ncbi:hypothetical protein SteCoe_28817 [Stentor coeruleus]|uniref:Ribosomal RNA-processing protein 42 n=1 Tax=Stentor coeruleus TaxID=5963 RepID=A0A1R2B7A2_9CILI|nr:hypothetical protein SteCoe_28817 [Stentor coeruleus]
MLSEKKFIIDGIKQGLRCDGRSPLVSRVVEISQSTELLASGSSQLSIELSSPHLICGIKTEIGEKPEISISIEMAGKSSQQTRDRLKEISTILQTLLIDHIDKSQLLIIPDKKAWKVFIDVLIVDENASSLCEQISLSVVFALEDMKIIGTEGFINKNTGEEFVQVTEDYWKLNMHDVPVIISINFIEDVMVLDLTEEEQACVDSTVHISIDQSGKIRGMVKEGHGELSLGQIASVLSVAKDAGSQIFGSLHRKIVHYKIVST